MTEYTTRAIPSSTNAMKDKKEHRRQVLEAVFARRRQNYRRYIKKLQEQLKQGKIAPSFD